MVSSKAKRITPPILQMEVNRLKLVYPAVFKSFTDRSGGYVVEFPDLLAGKLRGALLLKINIPEDTVFMAVAK